MQTEVARKLSEIFSSAGQAFTHMAELTMQLHATPDSQPLSGKWTDKEVDMLKQAVERFGNDLDKIGTVIKNRTQDQIKRQIKDQKIGSPVPAKGSENVPVRAASSAVVEERKPRLPAPASVAASSGPVVRTVTNPSIAPLNIAPPPPLVLQQAAKAPVKEQKARRGGASSSGSRPAPAAVTVPTTSLGATSGPKLASMLEAGKRAAPIPANESEAAKRMRQLSDYERLKMLREVESDGDEDEDDSDEDDEDDTSDDDDDE